MNAKFYIYQSFCDYKKNITTTAVFFFYITSSKLVNGYL